MIATISVEGHVVEGGTNNNVGIEKRLAPCHKPEKNSITHVSMSDGGGDHGAGGRVEGRGGAAKRDGMRLGDTLEAFQVEHAKANSLIDGKCKPVVDKLPSSGGDKDDAKRRPEATSHGRLELNEGEQGELNPAGFDSPPLAGLESPSSTESTRHLRVSEQGGISMVELTRAMKADAEKQEQLSTVIASMLEQTVSISHVESARACALPSTFSRFFSLDSSSSTVPVTAPSLYTGLTAKPENPAPAPKPRLLKQVSRNDDKGRRGGLVAFEGDKCPISASAFVSRIVKHSECSPCCLAISVLYLERLKRRHKMLCLTSNNFQRLFLISGMAPLPKLSPPSPRAWPPTATTPSRRPSSLAISIRNRACLAFLPYRPGLTRELAIDRSHDGEQDV